MVRPRSRLEACPQPVVNDDDLVIDTSTVTADEAPRLIVSSFSTPEPSGIRARVRLTSCRSWPDDGTMAPTKPPVPHAREWIAYLASGLVVAIALTAASASGVDVVGLLDDPLVTAGAADVRPWAGLISMFGSLLWAMGAGVWAVTAFASPLSGRERAFRAATASWMALLAFDDALLLHDHVLPQALGASEVEKGVLALYVAIVAAWGLAFSAEVRRTAVLPLALAAGSFTTSLVLDVIHSSRVVLVAFEDAVKVYGIGVLLAWSIITCMRRISEGGTPPILPG